MNDILLNINSFFWSVFHPFEPNLYQMAIEAKKTDEYKKSVTENDFLHKNEGNNIITSLINDLLPSKIFLVSSLIILILIIKGKK